MAYDPEPNVDLVKIGGTAQSGANVVDVANTALRVNVVAGGSGGGPATIADGADVAEGATTDAAVTSNTTGTISAKLRGLVAILADVWDSVNHRLKVDGSGVTQPVSGTVTVAQATAANLNATVVQSSGANLHVNVDSAPTTAVTNAGLSNLDVALSTRTKPADQQHTILDSGTLTGITNTVAISAASLPLPSGAAQDSSLATLHTDLTTLDTDLAIAQASTLGSQKGPMMQAVVSETPQSYIDNYIEPLSLTREGRLRVSSAPADITEVWNNTFANPFDQIPECWTGSPWN